ncbi:MAG TPA: hypothetical protein VK034_25675 [Enhygromyxa sp.]|nr:hypothetical protein [Enhygromyxa sp.]
MHQQQSKPVVSHLRATAFAVATLAGPLACGDGGIDAGDEDTETSTLEGEGEGDGDGDSDACDCINDTNLIYLLSDWSELWSYNPTDNSFAMISVLDCGLNFAPYSMSVDRSGVAWLLSSIDRRLYQTDVNDPNGTCTQVTNFEPYQHGLSGFTMGFASDSLADQCEYLYVHSASLPANHRLGVVDTQQDPMVIEVLGNVTTATAELTGTSDGKLFAFTAGEPRNLLQYDTTDASVIESIQLDGLPSGGAFAFAHRDGNFYFFTDTSIGYSTVSKYDYGGSQTLSHIGTAPFVVIGAGASNCAS